MSFFVLVTADVFAVFVVASGTVVVIAIVSVAAVNCC